MLPETWIYLILFFAAILLFTFYSSTGKFIRCMFFTAVTGLAALGIVVLVGRYSALPLSFTPFTLLTSTVLGIPGVVAMLLLVLV